MAPNSGCAVRSSPVFGQVHTHRPKSAATDPAETLLSRGESQVQTSPPSPHARPVRRRECVMKPENLGLASIIGLRAVARRILGETRWRCAQEFWQKHFIHTYPVSAANVAARWLAGRFCTHTRRLHRSHTSALRCRVPERFQPTHGA